MPDSWLFFLCGLGVLCAKLFFQDNYRIFYYTEAAEDIFAFGLFFFDTL